jgi:6-phosphogluconolactonase
MGGGFICATLSCLDYADRWNHHHGTILMVRRVEILPDLQALVDRAYEEVILLLGDAIAKRGSATLVLAGGGTPKPLYEKLALSDLPWSKIHLFWGDERYVPEDHPDSNYRMAREALIDRITIPWENIHPMPTAASDPAADAALHAAHLSDFFQLSAGDLLQIPQLDVVLLGMGDDGHTASLFPGTAALQVCDALVTVGEKSGQPRLTFTYPLLNQARTVLFMVAGENKQTALQQVFSPDGSNEIYPSRAVSAQENLIWLLDSAAGKGIPVQEKQ